MVKRDLLKTIDDGLLDKLYGFCYARTNDSYEAEELCSDIVYALLKAADTDGEIGNVYPFIWKVARNVYADYSQKRSKHSAVFYEGDPEKAMQDTEAAEEDDASDALILICRRICFPDKGIPRSHDRLLPGRAIHSRDREKTGCRGRHCPAAFVFGKAEDQR